ncbi:MAG: MATE family efflux transporter [Clostridia bacterium]|nr:MATE family efflux transporter [Clostridia bacterium]
MNKALKKDFTEGPMFLRMLLFALPIMLTGVLQIAYNMADNIVVGQFSGDDYALAAVGSTSSLTNLVLNLLLGVAAGTGVVVAQRYGAKDYGAVSKTVHTALSFSGVAGVAVMLIGLIISEPVLTLMGTKAEVLDNAVLYFRIICVGIPASSVYNFGGSVLRSVGDSKTPLIILGTSGILNVALNLFFVITLHMSVAGVALATIISQYASALAVMLVLYIRRTECYGFRPRELRFHKASLLAILRFGIPAGIQGCMFSISNVFITSAMNSFPTPDAVLANTIANNIDAISLTVMNAFTQAALTFTGQNFGAGKHDRVRRVLLLALLQVLVIGVAITQLELFFGEELIMLYISKDAQNKEAVIAITMDIITLLLNTFFLCGILDVMSGSLRGIGYSISPMLVNIIGICGVRILWIFAFFPMDMFNTPTGLMMSYPISWSLSIVAMAVIRVIAEVRVRKRLKALADNKNCAPAVAE